MRVTEKRTVYLFPKAPFVFDQSFYKPDHFPSGDTNWESGIRWQTMRWNGKCLGLKFEDKRSIKRPKISLSVWSGKALPDRYFDSLIQEIKYRYDLDADLGEFINKLKADEQLRPIVRKWPGMRIMSPQSLYEYLIIGIVLQNCTVKRSVSMMQTLFEHYGKQLEFDSKSLYCFWEPKDLNEVSEEELRSLKVGYRAKSIKRISQKFANDEVDEFFLRKQDIEGQRERLLTLYGVGPATVGYILFDVFKHYDCLDHISPWEQKIYSKLFFNRDPEKPVEVKKLLNLFEKRYGKWKTLAVNYIWEDLWWKRKNEKIDWLEKLIRL